jgi:trehalose-6-phosphatase
MIIAIDFDGTIVDHKFPDIGPLVPGAIEGIKDIQSRGHTVMLWTMRSNYLSDGVDTLKQAVDFCATHGVVFDYVNNNTKQWSWTNSNKQYAHIYIDDAALGCPLREHPSARSGRPCVDWHKVMVILKSDLRF